MTKRAKNSKSSTIQDVASLAGVSTATVSRVLANYEAVSDKTRQRVQDAIRELNFQINRNASNLRKGTFSKIGVVISDIQNPFFGSVVRGIENKMIEHDYMPIIGNSDEDAEQERKLITMMLEEGVAGIIFAPAKPDCDSYGDMLNTGTPFVAIDRRTKECNIDTILVDGCSGSSSAVEYLVEMGHQRIAFIGGLEYLSVMQEREKGYRETLKKHRLPVVDGFLRHGNNRQDGGYQEMKALLALPQPPSAVLIANNLMTLGGLKAIHEIGIKIPDQLSLIGFDDMDWATSLQPPLSVVAQPAFEMGVQAAQALLERIAEPGISPKNIQLQTKLIFRESVKAFRGNK